MERVAYEMAEKALNKENENRRKMRQSQVRVQSHEWMEKNRRKYQEQKERQIKMITQVLTSDVQAKAVENIELMERMHDLCAAEVGTAHRAAANLPNFDEVKSRKNRENTVRALSRGNQALLQEKQVAERAQQAVKTAQALRENVRKAEDYRFREFSARSSHMTRSQAAVERIVNKLSNKQNENKRRPEFQPSLAKSLRVPKEVHSETKSVKGGKKHRRIVKTVTYYDSSVPQGVLKYAPPAGLVQRHGKASSPTTTTNAFVNAKKVAEEQHKKERKSYAIQAQRAKEIQQRGKSALKVEKLQRQLTEITNELQKEGLNIDDKMMGSIHDKITSSSNSSSSLRTIFFTDSKEELTNLPNELQKEDLSINDKKRSTNSSSRSSSLHSLFLVDSEEDLTKIPNEKEELSINAKKKKSRSSSSKSSIHSFSLIYSKEKLYSVDRIDNQITGLSSPPDTSSDFPVTSTPANNSTGTSSNTNTTTTTTSSGSYSPRTAAKRKKALEHYIKRLLQMCPESIKNLAITSASTSSSSSNVEIPSSGISDFHPSP